MNIDAFDHAWKADWIAPIEGDDPRTHRGGVADRRRFAARSSVIVPAGTSATIELPRRDHR